MARRKKYRDVIKILRQHDAQFQVLAKRGKGSEVILFHPDIAGRKQIFTLTHHSDNDELGVGMLKAVIRRFNLPNDIFD